MKEVYTNGAVLFMMTDSETKLIIITGISGAGKTVAMQSLEDLGYYCVDNMPPTLIPKFLDLMKDSANNIRKVALVVDLRSQEFFEALYEFLDIIGKETWLEEQVLFLDAEDAVLVSRYKETRRSHPLNLDGLPLNGIQEERKILDELRGRSQKIIDTTDMAPKALRNKIYELFAEEQDESFTIHFVSFGFKYGIPIDADLVFDVRFLPNPHYVENMRPMTGLDQKVVDYVFKWTDTNTFITKLNDLFQFILPQYKKEGKSQLVIAFGCTGGQHRSVSLSEYFSKEYNVKYPNQVTHRDIHKRKGH